MKLTNYEKETIISFNDAEDTAECYTCNRPLISKLDKLCSKSPLIIVKEENEYSKTYSFPKKWVKVQMPRLLTEEEKQKRADMARENFHKQKKGE